MAFKPLVAEAEIRAILEAAVRPEGRLRIGTALAEASQKNGLTNADIEALEQARDARPAEPVPPRLILLDTNVPSAAGDG
jgi:hypothetical protein